MTRCRGWTRAASSWSSGGRTRQTTSHSRSAQTLHLPGHHKPAINATLSRAMEARWMFFLSFWLLQGLKLFVCKVKSYKTKCHKHMKRSSLVLSTLYQKGGGEGGSIKCVYKIFMYMSALSQNRNFQTTHGCHLKHLIRYVGSYIKYLDKICFCISLYKYLFIFFQHLTSI